MGDDYQETKEVRAKAIMTENEFTPRKQPEAIMAEFMSSFKNEFTPRKQTEQRKKELRMLQEVLIDSQNSPNIELHYIGDDFSFNNWEDLPDAEELRDENYKFSTDTGLTIQQINELLVIAGVKGQNQILHETQQLLKEVNILSEKINHNIAKINNLVKELI